MCKCHHIACCKVQEGIWILLFPTIVIIMAKLKCFQSTVLDEHQPCHTVTFLGQASHARFRDRGGLWVLVLVTLTVFFSDLPQ